MSHRDANLSDDERRTIPSNEATREGFVKNDLTAKALFDAISRLSAPAMLAAGALAQRKVERLGRVAMMDQDPFKVFFDTLFVFDPEKANINKSTSEQFIPYLWARLEARWLESDKRRCEATAVRTAKSDKYESIDIVSIVEDKKARDFTASVDRCDEYEWTRAALDRALTAGAIRRRDYEAVLQYCGLGGGEPEQTDVRSPTISTKMRAQRGIEHFRRYLRTQEVEREQPEDASSHRGTHQRIAPERRGPSNFPPNAPLSGGERRADRGRLWR